MLVGIRHNEANVDVGVGRGTQHTFLDQVLVRKTELKVPKKRACVKNAKEVEEVRNITFSENRIDIRNRMSKLHIFRYYILYTTMEHNRDGMCVCKNSFISNCFFLNVDRIRYRTFN